MRQPRLGLILLILSAGCRPASGPSWNAQSGVMDLSTWSVDRGPVRLGGDWEIYWQRRVDDKPDGYLRPQRWKGARLPDGTELPGQGYATYRLKVLVPDAMKRGATPLELLTEPALSAYRLSITDEGGRALIAPLSVGTFGESAAAARSSSRRLHPSFQTTGDFWVTLEVSNFETRSGGPWMPPVLGSIEQIESSLRHQRDLDFLVVGLFLVMALHHLGMFALRRSERGPLWLALITLLVALRVLLMGKYVDDPAATTWWAWLLRLEYLTFYVGVPLFALFVRSVFPTYASVRFVRTSLICAAPFVAVLLFFPPRVFTETLNAYQLISVVQVAWVLIILFRATRGQRDVLPLLMLLGFAPLSAAMIYDILHIHGMVASSFAIHFGLSGFIVFQSLLLAVGNQRARRQSEALNEELRRKVGDRSHHFAHMLELLAREARHAAELEPGAVMAERYRIEHLLGKGGMGAVYAAARLSDERPVALKVISLASDATVLARLAREAQAAATVNHPNVVSILDIDADEEGKLFIVMERVDGTSLEEKRKRFGDCDWAMPLLVQLARALAAIHAAEVVHRDLKPANVLLTDGGVVKVADFGIATLHKGDSTSVTVEGGDSGSNGFPTSALTQTGVVMGTPRYMAPEATKGARYVDRCSDMFSFGVIAYEMLSGERPFEVSFGPAFDRAPRSLRTLRPGLPAELAALLDRCLETEPGRRPRADILVSALDLALSSKV